MANSWYYARDKGKIGPCSGRQLKALAASGDILPTDTIWKEGVEKGALASKVEHLFAPVSRSTAPPALPERISAPASAPLVPLEPEPSTPTPSAAPERPVQQVHVRKGTAVAGKGAVITGQDGVNVRYKKKCMVCGHTDSYSHTMPIKNGTTRAPYFCPKCRKSREVEIKGSTS